MDFDVGLGDSFYIEVHIVLLEHVLSVSEVAIRVALHCCIWKGWLVRAASVSQMAATVLVGICRVEF